MSAVVHYPEARAIAAGPESARYVAACSCGWQADVKHPHKRDAIPAAIAHARAANHPTPGGPS